MNWQDHNCRTMVLQEQSKYEIYLHLLLLEVPQVVDWLPGRSYRAFAVAIRSLHAVPYGGHRDLVGQTTGSSRGSHIGRFAWECLECYASAISFLVLVVTLSP